jgi:hypothetical protein
MRSSIVVRASDCQCTSCNGPGFDPSIRRHSGIWGAADEAVLNIVRKKLKKSPQKIYIKTFRTFGDVRKNALWTGEAGHWVIHTGKSGNVSKPEIIKEYTPIYSCNAFWIAFFTHLYMPGESNKIPTTLNLTWHYQRIYDTRTFSVTITPESAYLYSNIFSSVVLVIP